MNAMIAIINSDTYGSRENFLEYQIQSFHLEFLLPSKCQRLCRLELVSTFLDGRRRGWIGIS